MSNLKDTRKRKQSVLLKNDEINELKRQSTFLNQVELKFNQNAMK